jgi:hypothetical protein
MMTQSHVSNIAMRVAACGKKIIIWVKEDYFIKTKSGSL